MSLISATTSRVPEHTADHINLEIQQQIDANVAYFAEHIDEIDDRLDELDREWDIERTLEANAASFSLLGLMLGLTVDRRWLALPVGVAAFLLQHAVQGWCPPVPLFRRLGIRTAGEIDQERYALKALRAISTMLPQVKPVPSGHATRSPPSERVRTEPGGQHPSSLRTARPARADGLAPRRPDLIAKRCSPYWTARPQRW